MMTGLMSMPNMNMRDMNTMTKRNKAKKTGLGRLKMLLVAGSVAATLAGTQLLASNESGGAATIPAPNPVGMFAAGTATPQNLPPTLNGAGQAIVLDLAPVTQAVSPDIQPIPARRLRPVTRTRTS